MNIKTLEVCSLVPCGELASNRWKICIHKNTAYEYFHSKVMRYCPDCKVDLELTENRAVKNQATKAMKIKYTNLKLKENFSIRRKDTFICWICYESYRNQTNNALTNSKYCPKCKKEIKNLQRANKHYDAIAINDLGLQGFIENTRRSDLIGNGSVFTQGFNQDDNAYSGLGRYTNGKAIKNNPFRELKQINKAYNDINKYGGDRLKQPSKSWKKSNITEEEYIDEVLGFVEEEIFEMNNNINESDDYYYD